MLSYHCKFRHFLTFLLSIACFLFLYMFMSIFLFVQKFFYSFKLGIAIVLLLFFL